LQNGGRIERGDRAFHRLGNGVDLSPVDDTPWVPRGHGRETTFQQDLTDWGDVEAQVRALALRVQQDILREGRRAVRVGLKVRYVPFETHTAGAALPAPTFDAEVIAEAAAALVSRFDHGRAVRLLGVRLEMEMEMLSAHPPGWRYIRAV